MTAGADSPAKVEPGPIPWGRLLWFLTLTSLLWLLLVRGCMEVCQVPPEVRWAASSGQPPPQEFRMVAFPVSADVQRFDAPSGAVVGVLDRAVGLRPEDEAADWVRISGRPPTFVRRSDLRLEPGEGAEGWMKPYGQLRRERQGQFVGLGVKRRRTGEGATRITFTEYFDDWNNHSTYLVRDGHGVPERLEFEGMGDGFQFFGRAAAAAPVAILLGAVGTRLLKRRLLNEPGPPRDAHAGTL
jgi:hypothetical protein